MEECIKTSENQNIKVFFLETLAWITRNCLSCQRYAVSNRVLVWVSYYNGVLSEYAKEKKNNLGFGKKKVKFRMDDHW